MKAFWILVLSCCLVLVPQGHLGAAFFGNGSLEKPVKLPTEEAQKVKGTGKFQDNYFSASLYNGSKWKVVEIQVKINRGNESRVFLLSTVNVSIEYHPNGGIKKAESKKTFAKQFENRDFAASIGTFLEGAKKGEWDWSIESVSGFED